jgi:hypothetical protein
MENDPINARQNRGPIDPPLSAIVWQHNPQPAKPGALGAAEHTYKHIFRGGVKATATVSLNPPSVHVQWEGRPTRKLFPEYCVWRRTIVEDVHRRTGVRIAVIDLL